MTIQKLNGIVQNYAWGSHLMLAKFQARPVPSKRPEAELWFGAHPSAPSSIDLGGASHKLDELINAQSSSQLGDEIFSQFGRLPFLLKVLAVDQPLSIQVHPSAEQARLGYQRERLAGTLASDSLANYRDDWAKPELLCPLTEFEALCGFRPIEELLALFEALGGDCFTSAAATLRALPSEAGLRQLVTTWLHARGDTKNALLAAALDACSRNSEGPNYSTKDAIFALDLARRYPGDMGMLVALLLRHHVLAPGVGLYVPAGIMHAYLHGFAIEVMASSDNVLRGGLTPKHVDVDELLSLLNFSSEFPTIVTAIDQGSLEKHFLIQNSYFRVSRVDASKNMSWCASQRIGPEMLLCVDGTLSIFCVKGEILSLAQGDCAWISADEDVYCISGEGQAFRVRVGERLSGQTLAP